MQFLYAVGPAGELADPPDDLVFALLLEPLQEKETRARAKAVIHLQQGREKFEDKFLPLLSHLARIEFGDEDGELGKAIKAWNSEEESTRAALDAIRHELNGNKDPSRLRQSLESLRLSNRASLVAAARVSASDPHFPALQELRDNALALRAPLAQLSGRLEAAVGTDLAALPELKAVAKAHEQVEHTSSRIDSYYQGLRANLPGIDQHLASVVDNYSPERLDRVDRAILRLGTYELLFDDEVPPAVAINEAIELARAFGTTESPSFVNGILDCLAKANPA